MNLARRFADFFSKKSEKSSLPIDRLLSDHRTFRQFVYTPREQVLGELEKRLNNEKIKEVVDEQLRRDIPEPLRGHPRSILFRQLVTPNFEVRRFIEIASQGGMPKPLFWEYTKDKFTNHNEYKHSLGKMLFFEGKGKKGGLKIERQTIIDFNRFNGKKIYEIETLWNENLVSLHHDLLEKAYKKLTTDYFFDASGWFGKHGKRAKNYYEPLMFLLLRNGILFENFLLNKEELAFTRDIFLPAFINAYEKTGFKPLIVELEPQSSEEDEYWMCHPAETLSLIKAKQGADVV